MSEFKVYNTQLWQKTRRAYKKSVGGLCEMCLSKGIIRAGKEVHHKVPITAENENDESIVTNFDNLILLCEECHHDVHTKKRRYKVDEFGRVRARY